MVISTLANRLYSFEEFQKFSAKKLNYLQFRIGDKKFKIGTSFSTKYQIAAFQQINNYLKQNICAFAVTNQQNNCVTVWHEIPNSTKIDLESEEICINWGKTHNQNNPVNTPPQNKTPDQINFQPSLISTQQEEIKPIQSKPKQSFKKQWRGIRY